MTDYTKRFTSQHRGKKRLEAWADAALGKTGADIGFAGAFDIETAVGAQLDTVGELVGMPRVLSFQPADGSSARLDDETYRMLLRGKIARNHWNGENGTLPDVWSAVFPGNQLSVRDNQDMTMTAVVSGRFSRLQTQLLQNGYVVPKPSTVSLGIVITETASVRAFASVCAASYSRAAGRAAVQ